MIVTEIQTLENVTDIFAAEYIEEINTRVDLSMTSRKEKDIRLLTGNKKELRQKTAELLIVFIDILNNQKDSIDISYEEIQDRVFKLREREKDMVTDRLKIMTDEQRDADTILKINKLGMYSKGMQKGLTMLDKDFYDEEQQFRDKMVQAERNIRKKNADANDENIDILLDEYLEQEAVDNDIDNEAYDMEFMNETYFDGNTDGVGAPEEEYDDYQYDN
jgi:DNA-binding protein H-NS